MHHMQQHDFDTSLPIHLPHSMENFQLLNYSNKWLRHIFYCQMLGYPITCICVL